MNTPLLASLFALAAALAWGSGDFAGGLAARRIGPLHTLFVSYLFGFLGLVSMALVLAEPLSSVSDLLWGAFSGILGLVGFLFMLHGFTVGRMGIVAPVSAVLSAAIPVVYAAFTLALPNNLQLLGFGIALASIWLISRREENKERPSGLMPALLAGVGFAGFFIALDQIGVDATFWPLAANRFLALSLMLGFVLFTRRPITPADTPWNLVIAAGLLDVIANVFFLRAVQTGRLDITSVLVSLYPAVTVLLARFVIGERLNGLQILGVLGALLAAILIAL